MEERIKKLEIDYIELKKACVNLFDDLLKTQKVLQELIEVVSKTDGMPKVLKQFLNRRQYEYIRKIKGIDYRMEKI